MSYNINSVAYISGCLEISEADFAAAKADIIGDDRPESCFLTYGGPGIMSGIGLWSGEGSGRTWETFKRALKFTTGKAELLVCWEGGDSISGLRVSHGVVTEHKVVHSLGEEIEKGPTD